MAEAGGHGVNQRGLIKMTPEEVDAFVAERRTMTMCSLGPDGSIHAVAMWYGFLDGCITVETKAKSQKVQNLRRDPRLTVLFEDGDTYDELRGVELVGRAEIVDDPAQLWALGLSVYERYYGPYSEEARPFLEGMLRKRVAVKLHPERTVSWDHRKLKAPGPGPAASMKFSISEKVAVSPDAAVAAYGDPAFYEGRAPSGDISLVEVVGHQDGPPATMEIRYKFTGSVSSAVRAVVDPAKLSWVTRTELRPQEHRTRFTVLPDHYPDRLDCSGTFLFTEGEDGPDSTVVTIEGDLKVHVFLVGRTVEQLIVNGLRSYLAAEVSLLPGFTATG